MEETLREGPIKKDNIFPHPPASQRFDRYSHPTSQGRRERNREENRKRARGQRYIKFKSTKLGFSKRGLKSGHPKHMHINSEVPTGQQHYRKSSRTPSGMPVWVGASLKCVHTTTCSMTNTWEEKLEICVHLKDYDLTGITET